MPSIDPAAFRGSDQVPPAVCCLALGTLLTALVGCASPDLPAGGRLVEVECGRRASCQEYFQIERKLSDGIG